MRGFRTLSPEIAAASQTSRLEWYYGEGIGIYIHVVSSGDPPPIFLITISIIELRGTGTHVPGRNSYPGTRVLGTWYPV